jgi:hypothetical protein
MCHVEDRKYGNSEGGEVVQVTFRVEVWLKLLHCADSGGSSADFLGTQADHQNQRRPLGAAANSVGTARGSAHALPSLPHVGAVARKQVTARELQQRSLRSIVLPCVRLPLASGPGSLPCELVFGGLRNSLGCFADL